MAKAISGWGARCYALALLKAAVKANELERVDAEVKALAEMFNRSQQLVKYLAQPLVPFEEKEKTLRQRLGGWVSTVTLNFLFSVVKHKRVEAFGHIALIFEEMVREYRGEVVAEVTTAVPLTDRERALTLQRLQEITGKKVLLSEKVDPSIIGGMKVIIGDKLLDLSLRGHLERIREQLRQVFLPVPTEVAAETHLSDPNAGEKSEQK